MKKQKQLSLCKVLCAAFIELFYKPTRGKSSFPSQLGKLKFVKELFPPTRPNPYYYYGLYKDSHNKKYFVKQWSGTYKAISLGASMLYQEIQINHLFNKSTNGAICKTLPIVDIFENSSQIFVVYPYMVISDFTKATTTEKYVAYKNALSFLEKVTQGIGNNSLLSTRKPLMYIAQYFLFFLRAFYLHRKERKLLIKSLLLFLNGYKDLHQSKLSIAHRDLHLGNILRVNKEQYLTDFALVTRTVDQYDLIRSYIYNLQDTALSKKLLAEINLLIEKNVVSKKYVQALTLFMLTHLLSVPFLPQEIHARFKTCLTSVINDQIFSNSSVIKKVSLIHKISLLLLDRLVMPKIKHTSRKPFVTKIQEQIVEKKWTGSRRSMHTFDLIQEIIVYTLFSKYKSTIRKNNKVVSIPRILSFKNSNTVVSLKTNYIPSKKGVHSFTNQFIYITEFLSTFTNVLSQEDKALIGKKGIMRFVSTSPLFLMRSIIRFPSLSGMLLSSYVLALITIPWVYKHNKQSIVHGDLHPENILSRNDEIYIIDFEQTHITSYLFEVATSLTSTKLSVSDELEFRNFVQQSFTPTEKIAIASLCYFNIIETIANVTDEKKVVLYCDRITFANKILFNTLFKVTYVQGGIL